MLLVFSSPIFLIVAILVRIFIGSPVLFIQIRPGLNKKSFAFYKFRTMSNATDDKGNLLPDNDRLNRFGQFLRKNSLDEIPQLINVIKGDLSLVGPRPLLLDYLPLYNEEQIRRHEVRPGITGWAQINGRNAISWEEKFTLDVWYVDNHSLFLDMKILILTVFRTLMRAGISADGQATMPRFTGTLKKEVR